VNEAIAAVVFRLAVLLGLASAFALAPGGAWGAPESEWLPPPASPSAREIAARAENAMRSDRTRLEAEMTITSPQLSAPRVVSFRSWDDEPGKRSFIRILSPPRDAGTGFLKLHPNLWMYLPRVERTIRVPPSMMLQSWMGSDFTNDDLVRSSSALDDYEHRLLGIDPSPDGHGDRPAWVVEYTPHEEAAVSWGRIVAWVEVERGTPLRQDFYDEAGARLRTMQLSDIRPVGDRAVPHTWTMTPLDEPGHETRIEVRAIEFDAALDDSIFTKQNLRKARR
jgi:outer membrane lipoprotein-sorting protein